MFKLRQVHTFILAATLWLFMPSILTANGLRMVSNKNLITERTSYNVFDGQKRVRGDSVAISFDVQVYGDESFGHLLNIDNGQGRDINLVQINFRDEANTYFDLNIDEAHQKLSLKISKVPISNRKWHKMTLSWSYTKDKIYFQLDNNRVETTYNFGKRDKNVELIFGLFKKYPEVPEVQIRQVSFFDGDKSYLFPLNESSGNKVHDVKGQSTGVVKNPDWIVYKHMNWQKRAHFESNQICGTTLDTKRSKILFYSKNDVKVYDIPQGTISKLKNTTAPPFRINSGEALYIEPKDCVVVYNMGIEESVNLNYASIDLSNDTIYTTRYASAPSKLHHHSVFADKSGNNIYLFGGYGNFHYSDRFRTFDELPDHSIKDVEFSGDRITPRFFSAVGDDFYMGGNNVYIFGGFGNESGNQENGGENLYDFYKIDPDNRTVKHIFTLNNVEEDFIPASNLIVFPKEGAFYAFCYPHHLPSSDGYLYRFAMDGSGYKRVANAIPVLSEKIMTNLHLFFNRDIEEFVLVKQEFSSKDSSIVSLYSIRYPLIDPLNTEQGSNKHLLLLLIGAAICGGVMIVAFRYMNRRRSGHKMAVDNGLVVTDNSSVNTTLSTRNSFYLLGEFVVYDSNGNDISFRFSTKMRQLFFIILLNTYSERKGITSEAMSDRLWDGMDSAQAKNNRGVAISNLRGVLTDIEGIELAKEKNIWKINIDPKVVFIDYVCVMGLSEKDMSTRQQHEDMIALLERGTLLKSYGYRWLDPFKSSFESKALEILTPMLESAFNDGDYHFVLRVTNAILSIDPLNEYIVGIEVIALKKTGRGNLAKTKLLIFEQEYMKAFNHKPSIKIK